MNIRRFLDTSYTSFHATANAVKVLKENGFVCLDSVSGWKHVLKPHGKYFCTKNQSTLITFVLGEQKNYSFKICLSHTDSPSLKIKGDKTIVGNGVTRLNVENYGSSILYSFFDRRLKIAGRIFPENGKAVEGRLYDSGFNVVIPSLCIHHNPSVNDGFSPNMQADLLPILCEGENQSLYNLVSDEKILDADLFVVPSEESFLSGVRNEFLNSPRIDNLTSVFASLEAILNCKPNGIAVCCMSDNEEIGSRTRQGAAGSFLESTLKRLNEALGFNTENFVDACEKGAALSVDNGHAVHPAHPEKSDLTNKVFLNKGVVIKHHPNYATDGQSAATLKSLLNKNGIAHQDYYNRSDLRCGSTVGCIVAAQLGMSVCDIGLPQLSMHSACETVGMSDIEEMKKCIEVFLND